MPVTYMDHAMELTARSKGFLLDKDYSPICLIKSKTDLDGYTKKFGQNYILTKNCNLAYVWAILLKLSRKNKIILEYSSKRIGDSSSTSVAEFEQLKTIMRYSCFVLDPKTKKVRAKEYINLKPFTTGNVFYESNSMETLIDFKYFPWAVQDTFLKMEASKELNPKTYEHTWSTPQVAYRHFIKCRETSVDAFLQRNFPRWSHERVVTISKFIHVCITPPELIFCKSPEDYYTMYSSGPTSCMSVVKGKYDGNIISWEAALGKNGHPCAWYHYHPLANGVFMMKGGKVSARTIVYTSPDGSAKFFGRVYGLTAQEKEVFMSQLRKKGYELMSSDRIRHTEAFSFEVPGIKAPKSPDYMCPVPYTDNYSDGDFIVDFDIPKKVFVFTYAKSGKKMERVGDPASLRSTSGILAAKTLLLKNKNCCVCGRRVERDWAHGHAPGGRMICGAGCGRVLGLTAAISVSGDSVIRQFSDCVRSAYDMNYYTTLGVLAANHGVKEKDLYPYLEYPDAAWDGQTYGTMNVLLYQGQKYSFAPNFITAATRKGSGWKVADGAIQQDMDELATKIDW